ncbi:MAG: hypothetical protein JNN15_06765 [Blastocatellia bacterium]|nr:hypothetical protein [Blastocatellia bacterium]
MIKHAEEWYQRYFESYSTKNYEIFIEKMRQAIGHDYKLSNTPLFLSQNRFNRLTSIANSVVKLLQSPIYQKQVTATGWFLPQNQMQTTDYFGDIEFHLSPSEEKIMEINFNPPGLVGLLEVLESSFLEAFEILPTLRVNQGFEKLFAETISENFKHKKIAIGVSHLSSSRPYYPHYKYFEKILGKYGIDGRVFYARDVELGKENLPVWNGDYFEKIFNLLIVKVWQDRPKAFFNYTKVYQHHPELFFLNPLGWKLGNKSILSVFHNIEHDPLGLSAEDVENIKKASLKSYLLSSFTSAEDVVEEFGCQERIVLKPLNNYQAKGVEIKPSFETIKNVFAKQRDNYIVQEYFAPGKLPSPQNISPLILNQSPDIVKTERLFSLRIGFFNGKSFGARAYTFTDPPTYGALMPVVVVQD